MEKNGENAAYQHFLLFSQCFQKTSLLGSLKVWIVFQSIESLSNSLLLENTVKDNSLTHYQITNFRLF